MADVFNNISVEKNPKEDLCVVYVLYFDEKKGQIPLLMYPDDTRRSNKKYMRPVHYHPVWFLETDELDHIDLEYKGYTFFGKKFLAKSNREKRRAGLKEETPETIVLIVSLPNEIDIFGDDLIRILTNKMRAKFEDQLSEVIESEIASENVIKTPKIQELINEGKKIKLFLRELIDSTIKEYFSKVLEKKSEAPSLKAQKAISYFSLRRYDFSPLSNLKGENTFSNIDLFDPKKQVAVDFSAKNPLSVKKIYFIENSQEIELIVQNNKDEELNNLSVMLTHVKEFFEKEVMTQHVDIWFPHEELLFISPIVPHIDEYLFSIRQLDESGNGEKILTQRIDLKLIERITS
ncbi:MAG: hypothetical protein ACFFHD_08110 [Promethearchaeota archaeon]